MNSTVDVILNIAIPDSCLGKSVSSAGDVNGDGYSDVIVGAENYGSGKGRAYIYLGEPLTIGGAKDPEIALQGEITALYNMSLFGSSVSTAGDVNGDGSSDVIVGAPLYSGNGRAYIYLSSAIGSPANKTFRTKTSGNWNTPLTWEMSLNGGSTWVPATSYPNSQSDIAQFKFSHSVTCR
ncbi:MAG: FG-GAP repeat protein [Ignavibacteria bacterium]|nr:FG-GAP repeat protein [Ignavibacteria bacterium]